jgi:hypothetical protein
MKKCYKHKRGNEQNTIPDWQENATQVGWTLGIHTWCSFPANIDMELDMRTHRQNKYYQKLNIFKALDGSSMLCII